MIIREAIDSDNEALCQLCEHTMPGHIQISLERRPSYFIGSFVQNETIAVFVCIQPSQNVLEGVFSLGSRRVWLNGKIQTIKYLSDLRLSDNSNKAKTLFHICNYIRDNELLKDSFAQTIVFEDNSSMHKIIELLHKRSKKHEVFQYYKHGTYLSWMLNLKNKPAKLKDKIEVRRVNKDDIHKINSFIIQEASRQNFFPYYQLKEQENAYNYQLPYYNYFIAINNSQIIGLCAIWDQNEFKQTKIKSYSSIYHFIRPFYNFFSKIIGGFIFPEEGKPIPYLTLHCVLIKDKNTEVFKALLNEIIKSFQGKRYQYILCGLSEKDDLQKTFDCYSSKRSIRGHHYLVAYKKPEITNDDNFYIELSRI